MLPTEVVLTSYPNMKFIYYYAGDFLTNIKSSKKMLGKILAGFEYAIFQMKLCTKLIIVQETEAF